VRRRLTLGQLTSGTNLIATWKDKSRLIELKPVCARTSPCAAELRARPKNGTNTTATLQASDEADAAVSSQAILNVVDAVLGASVR
jgi:hypothetical protein